MKRLFLLRHAEAPGGGNTDIDRTLTNTGKGQAQALGALMADKGYQPDFVLCSAAVRTRQTFEGVKSGFDDLPVHYDEAIYHASTGDLLNMIQKTTAEKNALMIIGHNPTIYQLAVMLAKDDNSSAMNALTMGYPPGSLTVLGCDLKSWAEIQPGENLMLNLHHTAQYFVPDTASFQA